MTVKKRVTDEQYAALRRRTDDLIRRVDQCTVPYDPTMKSLQDFIEGKPLVVGDCFINCNANPYTPNGWRVIEHVKSGMFQWNRDNVSLYLSDQQKNGKSIEGNQLRKELKDKPVFNANVLDYLLANQHLIPKKWQGRAVFFWGTIYCNSMGDLYVRCLVWRPSGWCWRGACLVDAWNCYRPAAVFTNNRIFP